MPKKPQYAAIASQNAFVVSLSEWDSLELLVPQIGCNSCINLLIDNYKENGIKTKLLMVGVSREKDLRLNYGNEFVDNPNVEIYSDLINKTICHDCFGQPALLLYKADTIHYFCFKTDEVNSVISYLSNDE